MPDLHQLRIFVTVADELSFTRAGERLHLGQQAVSKAVRQLERELGVDLLTRTTRAVRLTEPGAVLLASGREVLAAADAAFQRTREAGRGLSGTVTVGATLAIGSTEREKVVQVLRTGARDLSISLLDVRTDDIPRLLCDRRVDLVLARSNGAEGLRSTELRPTPAILCVPSTHPLAATRSVGVAQIDGARLMVWRPPGTPYTDLLLARLSDVNCRVEPVLAQVTGGSALSELNDIDAVALMPQGWPLSEGITQVALEEDISLPFLMLSPSGVPTRAVRRVRAGMAA